MKSMEDSDKKRFAELMAGLAQTFITDISAQDLENYWRLLKNYPLSQIEQAIVGYCISPEGHRFMPKPGEIIAAVHGKESDQSLLAWVKVTQGIRQAGASKTVVFDDPMIHAVIADLGGWIRLCHLTTRELSFQQREFERLYACYCRRPLRQYPYQLTGINDTANAAAGYALQQKPVLLGDPAKAAQVYKNGNKNYYLPAQTLSVQQIMQFGENQRLDKANKESLQHEDESLIDDKIPGEPHDR
jgi:hypothetical protein